MAHLAPTRLLKTHLAKECGCSPQTIHAVLRMAGAPRPNQKGMFDVQRVKDWIAKNAPRASNGGVLVEMRQRKLSLEADRMQFELSKARGEFIAKGEVAKTLLPLWGELHQMLRQEFEFVLPSKYKGKSQIECQQLNIAALDAVAKGFREGALPLTEMAQVPA